MSLSVSLRFSSDLVSVARLTRVWGTDLGGLMGVLEGVYGVFILALGLASFFLSTSNSPAPEGYNMDICIKLQLL